MHLDRRLFDAEFSGNFFIAKTFGNEFGNFKFSVRKLVDPLDQLLKLFIFVGLLDSSMP